MSVGAGTGTPITGTTYGTVARLRAEHLPQVTTGATNDALLLQMLDTATAFVNDALGFAFTGYAVAAKRKFQHDAARTWLRLPYYQAGTLTTLGRCASTDSTTNAYDYDSDDYEIEADDHTMLYADGGWPAGRYEATAAWGYGTAPESIVKITMQLAADLWAGRDVRSQSNAAGVEGPGQVTVQRAFTWQQYQTIQTVRRQYGQTGTA